MEINDEDNDKLLMKFYFITSIEKNFYEERHLEFINGNKKSQNINDFEYKVIFEEEFQADNKLFINKLNSISFQMNTLQKQDMLNNNNIFFKIKDGTKIYLYDCIMEYNLEAISNDKTIYYIYNFDIGELRKDNQAKNNIILDSVTNIQTSIIEMKENSIPQKKLNFDEKFNFFMKGIKSDKNNDNILLMNYLLKDTLKEIESKYIKNKTKIQFLKLLEIAKIIYEEIYLKNKENNSNLNPNIIFDNFINLFDLLLTNKLIFYDEIEGEKLKEYFILLKDIEKDNNICEKFGRFIHIFYGNYEENEKLMAILGDQKGDPILSDLYKNNLYKPKNEQIKEKLTNILMLNCKGLKEYISIIDKNDSITGKLELIIKYFDILKKIINENDDKELNLPIKFDDSIKSEEAPSMFYNLHQKIIELELSLENENKNKSIFDFSEIIKNYIKLYESGIGTRENCNIFLTIKRIIIEENKINKELMESLYKYVNKLIHSNIVEMVNKNSIDNINLINNLHEDEFFNDEFYKVNDNDYNILNGFRMKEIYDKKDNEFFDLYNKYEIWKPFCKTTNDIKKYIEFIGDKLDNILCIEIFFKILPKSSFNYHSLDAVINWVKKNIPSINIDFWKNNDDKKRFLEGMNNLFQLCTKTHYEQDKYLSFLEDFFLIELKHKKDLKDNNEIINGIEVINELYIYFINNYNTENNNSIPINYQSRILSFYNQNAEEKINNMFLYINFLNNVTIDSQHLELEQLLNNLDNFIIKKSELLSDDNNINFEIYNFLINKYKTEFDDKRINSNYLVSTRKIIKNFIIKDIEQSCISFIEANTLFNNNIDLENRKHKIINKFVLCSKIKKINKNENEIENNGQQSTEQLYESVYNDLTKLYIDCKNVVDNLERLLQFYLFFGNEKSSKEIEDIKEITNELKETKLKDFFKNENTAKFEKYKQEFEISNVASILKNSLCFNIMIEEVAKKLNDPNLMLSIGNQLKDNANYKMNIVLGSFNRITELFYKFNESSTDSFVHPYILYFYNIELNQGDTALKKEVDFIINYFSNYSKEEKHKQIINKFDKNKFLEFIKNYTKREKILLKCEGIKHIIDIFLSPENYVYINKEEKNLEEHLSLSRKKKNKAVNLNREWSLLDFESNLCLRSKYDEQENNNTGKNDNKNENEIKEKIEEKKDNINDKFKQKLNSKLENSEIIKILNKFIQELKDDNISLIRINEIISVIDSYNLGINSKDMLNNQNDNLNEQQKLIEKFFLILLEKPEAIYYIKMKKYKEIKTLFQNSCIEIENTILKEEDINDFLLCTEKINIFSLNVEKMLNDDKINDLPKEIVTQFIKEIKNNENNIFIKSLINYLNKFNQIKSIVSEIIASPEVSIKKIKKILSNSDFIISYDNSKSQYLLYGNYYEIFNQNDIKEVQISYKEMENLRERLLTMNKNVNIYEDSLLFIETFNNIKEVLATLDDLDKTGYPDKIYIIINIKNKKINCNYDNKKFFNNLKDLTNNLIEQKRIQSTSFENYYESNEVMRLFYGKQLSLLYNFIRYKENQGYVDSLFQLISRGRINSGYPPQYENYSENLFEDMINNVCNYCLLVFVSNQIHEPNHIFNLNNIKIKDEKGEDYKGIYLYLSSSDNSEKEILSYYMKFTNNLPLYAAILLCNYDTTEEEIISFLYRSILCEENVLFMIVNSNHLEPKQRKLLINLIKKLSNKLVNANKKMKSSLFIFSTESNSEIFQALKSFNSEEHPIKILNYSAIDDKLNDPQLCQLALSDLSIVKSDASGVGKSRYIRNIPGAYESNMIYLPLGGYLTRKSIFQRLIESLKKINIKNLTVVYLFIDLNQTNEHEILKEFLFELLIFRKYSLNSRNSDKIIYISKKFNIQIELPYESLGKSGYSNNNDCINKYSIFTLFKKETTKEILLANLIPFYEEMSEQEKKNLIMNPEFEFIKSLSESKLQLVSKTLQLYKNKNINNEQVIVSSTECLTSQECNDLLNEQLSKVNLPNFYQKNIFIKLLYDQFLSFHQNSNLIPKNLIANAKKLKMKNYKTINEIREQIIKYLIDHAIFFTIGFSDNIMRSQERTKEILQMQDYNQRKKLSEELKERENISKLRYETIQPSPLLFEKGGNGCKIIPTCKEKSDEETFLINLQKLLLKLPKNKKDIPPKYNQLNYPSKMNSQELMDELLDCVKGSRRLSLDVINKILSEYALTPDNYIKMVLILNRINSDIPVILMGETGCGKTSLIKILANVIFRGYLNNLKILNIHSGIEDNEIIKFIEQLISEAEIDNNAKFTSAIDEFNSFTPEQQNNYLTLNNITKEKLFERFKKVINEQKIWVFFDEINASNSMGLLSEILCKKTYFGKKIPERFVFLAACNPYRAMGELNKIDHTLIHKGQEKRKLVYTVYPLPNNMLNFVLDFGNLSLNEEKKYIEIMISKSMEQIIVEKNKAHQNQIIKLAIESISKCQTYIKNTNDISSVSLREVKRFIIFFKYFVVYLLNKKNSKSEDPSIKFYSLNNIDIYKYAVNLSLYICYYLRLPDKKSRQELLKILDDKQYFDGKFLIVPEMEEEYIAKNILESRENESLSKGIAKNRALLENLFSLYFCTVNKIPLIICGKPGSTKTLSQKLLQNALKGMVSKNKLCKETKELVVFPYQGSVNSTSEEIIEVFKKAKNYQKSNEDTISMVCFDEMGLAEISKNNPLKVIHSELEMNFDFENKSDDYLFNKNDQAKVAFLGISNWSLDASKMNRAIFNVIQEPDIIDLKKTSVEIASSINEKIANKYISFLDRISTTYYEYIQQKKRDDRMDVNFHGLRDFYNIIKCIMRELSSIENNENNSKILEQKDLDIIAMKNIERNFGGLPSSIYDFKLKYYQLENDKNDIKSNIDNNYDMIRCISENLFDKDSRYLLLITRNNLDLDLINFLIDEIKQSNSEKYKNDKFETKYLIGSTFVNDNKEVYREDILGTIRNEMKTNNLLILKNLESIYTSLYDLLNQDFMKIDDKYYTRISFGLWKPLSHINQNFKIIVIINEKNVCYEDPPFLNRFEKHIFNLENLLNKEEKKFAKEIYDIVMRIVKFEKCKMDLNKHLVNFNLEELEALVYKFSKQKQYFKKNLDIIYEILKIIVPTFTQEIIASIFVSGFKEEKKDIADKIFDIYTEYHPCNLSDFVNNKMIHQKNVVYTYSSITDDLVFYNNKKNENEIKGNVINDNSIQINDINDHDNPNRISIMDEPENYNEINMIEENITFDIKGTKQIYVESIKSVFELEKIIDDYLNEEHKNLFVMKFRNKSDELNKMTQINYLIDDRIMLFKNSKNVDEKYINQKYFILLVYLVREDPELNNKKINEERDKDINNNISSSGILSKLTDNCQHVFIDNLYGKDYDFIKTLTMKDNDLVGYFFIEELKKNIDTSFRFMAYEFSKNETPELNRQNYRQLMTEKILNNKYIQNILKKSLLKLSIGTKEILKPIFIKEDEKKKNKNKKNNKTIVYDTGVKGYTDFIELFKSYIFERTEFYLIKIIFCLEKSQILHSISFNNEMLKKKLVTDKIIKNYIDNELEEQLSLNKISTNFNMKNKLNIILSIKIPYISKVILQGKIFNFIKKEITFKYVNNEFKLIDVIKSNSMIEETINDYNNVLKQLNENIYIEMMNQEILKDIIYSNDKYLIMSLYEDLLLLFLLDGKKFENGDNFKDFYRLIDILIQLRFLNTQEDNFAFVGKNKTISLLKTNDIIFKNNINDINKVKSGLMIAKILGFLFGYQNEIYTLLEIFSLMSKYIPGLIKSFEDIVVNKEVRNEISERNPDYCRIVKECFFIVYESLLHSITKQYNKYNLLEASKSQIVNKNKININNDDSDLDDDDDEDEDMDFSIINNNNNAIYDFGNDGKNLLSQFGDIPIQNIESICKISVLLEKKMLLYSKELFMIKNLSKIFEVLNKKQKKELITKENITAITNIICSEEKYIYERNFKFLLNNFMLLMELLGKMLGKDSKEYGDIIIYLIMNQFLNIKDISYKVKLLNLILPDTKSKKSKVKREVNPIILQKSLSLLVLLLNNGKDFGNEIEPIYNQLSKEERRERFLKFVKDENSPQYQLLKVINKPNQILDEIIIYYFEYLCELYFQKIKKENKENLEEELIGKTSLDYLDESLLFLDDEINGANTMGNKQNYLNKLGKLFSIAYVKKYIVNYVDLNFNSLYKIFIWEDINSVLYNKDNKLRRMVKYFILKQYCKNFLNEKDFIEFNFNNQKIPFSSKFTGFKLETNKHQFEYNVLPLSYTEEYKKFARDLTINSFNKNKFNDFISDNHNINTIDLYFCFFVNNFLLQNYHNDFFVDENGSLYRELKDQIQNLTIIPEEAKKVMKLLDPNEFFKSVKPFLGNKLSLKIYEIFIYALRFSLISLKFNKNNLFNKIISNSCFNVLSDNYIPGKTESRNIFKESYEVIKENLTKDPLNYGAYICSCGYHYSVGNCTFPTVTSPCPICHETIGGTAHRLYRRTGHMRVFLNDNTRKTKFSPSYADKTMPNMLLDEFYNNVVLKQSSGEVKYSDRKRPMGCNKEDYLKREPVRGLTQITYRTLNFILNSHLFISRILNYISEENLNIFTVKDMTIFEMLETGWDIIEDLLKEKKIKDVQIYLNIIYPHVYNIIDSCEFFEEFNKFKLFESLFEQKINEILKDTKQVKEYEGINSNLLDYNPLSDMAIIYEKFPPQIYDQSSYPEMQFFINSRTPTIDNFKNKFAIISNSEDKYPLTKIILTQDMDKINLLKEIPKLNKLGNYLLEKCSFRYSRDSANNTKLKTEFNYNEIKQDVIDFIDSWNKIRPIIENYGCKQFKNNGQKYFTEINSNSPISYFLVDEGEFGHGMVLAAIYKKLIELQNTFLNQIINSKSEILSCFKEQLSQEIMIQDCSINEIIDLDRIKDDILNDIIVKNTIPNIFNLLQTEKKLNFDNINNFEHDYENIEKELGSLLLPGLKKFKQDDIRFVTYKYEGFRGNKSSIITNFNEKYPQRELNKNQISYIFDFIFKGDLFDKKNKTSNKKNIKKILFSLQLLIDYIQRENYDKYESLYDIIKKLPQQINICQEIKQFFKGKSEMNAIKENKDDDGYNLLSNDNNNNIDSNSKDTDNVYFSINTLISIFELFEHLCWDSFKENLVGDYLQKIDDVWGKKIQKYFNDIDKNPGKIIKKNIFCSAIRRFISRYLTGKRGENEINENNTLVNEILRPELWKPFFTESDSFEMEIGEIMSILTHEFEGSLKVGQALELYDLLGGDQKLLDNAKANFVY